MTNKFTTINTFSPTPHMLLWLDTAVEIMSDNISEIADKCKISRQSWYLWIKNGEFIEWYYKEWNVRLRANLWKLDAIGFRKAKREFKFWEAMQKKLGGFDSYNQGSSPEPLVISWETPYPSDGCKHNDG